MHNIYNQLKPTSRDIERLKHVQLLKSKGVINLEYMKYLQLVLGIYMLA